MAALSYWLSVRLNALGSTVAGSTALALYAQSLANEDKLSPPEAGLVLTYAVSFTAAIIGLMRTYTELELSMNAVERIAVREPVWKSNFGRPTPSTRRCLRSCVRSMAWRFTKSPRNISG